MILSDNLNLTVPGDSAERFAYEFADDFSGWRLVSIPGSASSVTMPTSRRARPMTA